MLPASCQIARIVNFNLTRDWQSQNSLMAERATGVLTITAPFQTPTLMARKWWLHRASGILMLRSSGLTRRHIHAIFVRTCGQMGGVAIRFVPPSAFCGATMAQPQFRD